MIVEIPGAGTARPIYQTDVAVSEQAKMRRRTALSFGFEMEII
jgi:hypothetical protein